MVGCSSCRKHIGLVQFECRSCGGVFCTRCRIPESHDCPAIEQMKKKKKADLSEKLLNEATHDNRSLTNKL